MINFLKDFFGSSDNLAILISAVSAFVATISTITALVANHRSQKHYKKSVEPQLSMKLVDFDSVLYLQIKNTGKTVARKISIAPKQIVNNGDCPSTPNTDGLFSMEFELYPSETVQSAVGFCYQTLCGELAFPQLTISVTYYMDGVSKPVSFERTVTYAPAYDSKITADINYNSSKIEGALKSISRASVRTANYLDGNQVAEFDELNILANKSLENDLRNALGKDEKPILSREDIIKN